MKNSLHHSVITLLVFVSLHLFSNTAWSLNYTLSVLPETCSGNGSVTITIDDPNPSSIYSVLLYQLPTISQPFMTSSNLTLTGLHAGNYLIVVRENTNGQIESVERTFSINDEIDPLDFSIHRINQVCSLNSNISITLLSGQASGYEIINGPVTRPFQVSPDFLNLPNGIYQFRVYDSCGNAHVKTYTITHVAQDLTTAVLSSTLVNCNLREVAFAITPNPGTQLGYPLQVTVTYSVNSVNLQQTLTLSNGLSTISSFALQLPMQIDSNVLQVDVLDSCGVTYGDTLSLLFNFNYDVSILPLPCMEHYFRISISNGMAPYTLQFISAPSGFVPSNFNSNYPLPFTSSSISFGSLQQAVPPGIYELSVTDSCGNSFLKSFEILRLPPEVTLTASTLGCLPNQGVLTAAIPNYGISTAFILDAPSTFTQPIPFDLAPYISSGELYIDGLPSGFYQLKIKNLCTSLEEIVTVTIPVYLNKGVQQLIRNGCTIGTGSVRLESLNGRLTAVRLLNCPAAYQTNLPFDLSSSIATSSGLFSLDALLPGQYVFELTDTCGFVNTVMVVIDGLSVTSDSFTVIENCGSFDLNLAMVNTSSNQSRYWLQKLIDPAQNVWGHPYTATPFLSTGSLNATNSFPLVNQNMNFNFTVNGTFRIVHSYRSFADGAALNNGSENSLDRNCYRIITPTFAFNRALEIVTSYNLPCSSNFNTVTINALGETPLHYSIVAMNGNPFLLDNGNSNVFQNLQSGIYQFQVEDSCGNLVRQVYDLATMPSLLYAVRPNDLVACTNESNPTPSFDLESQSSIILGAQAAQNYTISYYSTLNDANLAINPILTPSTYTPLIVPSTVYARVVFTQFPSCFQVTDFNLHYLATPRLTLQSVYRSCSLPFQLDLSMMNVPSTQYFWSDGHQGASRVFDNYGVFDLDVTAVTPFSDGNFSCSNSKNIQVIISQPPQISAIAVFDWTFDDHNSFEVHMSDPGAYEYSLGGEIYQSSPLFTSIPSGIYMVYVNDLNGCGVDKKQVAILNYPHYFTPNSDGIHDEWKLFAMHGEPLLQVFIYDRFGKLLHSMYGSASRGWDGTYNALPMPATDYWFEVHRENEMIHRGHFSLKR